MKQVKFLLLFMAMMLSVSAFAENNILYLTKVSYQNLRADDGQPVQMIVSYTNGVLKVVNSALPKVFYMPSITLDVSTLATGKTVDLYAAYLSQFGSPKVGSQGAPSSIPTYTKDQLYYYVTYFDPNVFSVTSVDANGLMTYNVIGSATSSSYMNIVFVVK